MTSTEVFMSIVAIGTVEVCIVLAFLFYLSDRIDQMNEKFTNHIRALLWAIEKAGKELDK
jgi:hypothetical protein